jgi:hypothetical protein
MSWVENPIAAYNAAKRKYEGVRHAIVGIVGEPAVARAEARAVDAGRQVAKYIAPKTYAALTGNTRWQKYVKYRDSPHKAGYIDWDDGNAIIQGPWNRWEGKTLSEIKAIKKKDKARRARREAQANRAATRAVTSSRASYGSSYRSYGAFRGNRYYPSRKMVKTSYRRRYKTKYRRKYRTKKKAICGKRKSYVAKCGRRAPAVEAKYDDWEVETMEIKSNPFAGDIGIVAHTRAAGSALADRKWPLTSFQHGTKHYNRAGRLFTVDGIYIRGVIEVPTHTHPSVLRTKELVTCFVIIDSEPGNTLKENLRDVYKEYHNSHLNVTGNMFSGTGQHRVLEETGRYSVVKVKTIRIPSRAALVNKEATNYVNTGIEVPFTLNLKMNFPVKMASDSTTATIENVKNQVMYLFFTRSGFTNPGGGDLIRVSLQGRTRFHDGV